jgi:hypothetical protein
LCENEEPVSKGLSDGGSLDKIGLLATKSYGLPTFFEKVTEFGAVEKRQNHLV